MSPSNVMTTCAQCGRAFESASGKVGGRCPDCLAAEQQFRDWLAHLLQSKRLRVAPVLMALNIGIFVLMVAKGISPLDPSGSDLIPWGADYGPLTLGGEWWRLLTSNFLHFGFLHLALNMWCLWDLSQLAERLVGGARFAIAYVLSGISGSVASVWWEPSVAGAGASGAVFGVAGLLLAILFFGRLRHVPRVGLSGINTSLMIFIAYNLALGAARTGISNSAHMGGLVAGLVFGWVVPIHRPRPDAGSSAPVAMPDRKTVLATLGIAILLVAGYADARRRHEGVIRLERTQFLMETERSAEALAELQRIARERPEVAEVYPLLGRAAVLQKRPELAIPALQKALERSPRDGYLNALLGYALILNDQHAAAVAPLRQAVEQDPEVPSTRFNLGLAYLESGQFDAAIEQFRVTLQHLPKDDRDNRADALSSIGDASLRKGDWPQAIDHLRQATQLLPGPESYSVWSLLEMAYRMSGDSRKAAEIREHMKNIETQAGNSAPEPKR